MGGESGALQKATSHPRTHHRTSTRRTSIYLAFTRANASASSHQPPRTLHYSTTNAQGRTEAGERRIQAWEAEVQRVRSECMHRVEEAERQAYSLETKLVALRGAAEGQAAAITLKEREARVELLYRRMTRRMMYSSLASGWAAWFEYWEVSVLAD